MSLPRALLLASLLGCASSPQVPAPPAPLPSAPAATAAFVVPPPPDLRLPAIARPARYDLALWLDPHATAFRGQVSIDLEILSRTRVLWLNATDLAIDSATLAVNGAASAVRPFPGGDDFVGFALDREVDVGKARLSIAFHGKVDAERSRGIYAVHEGDGEPYLYTFFEMTDARRAFPCFDEPGYKVPWKLSLHVPAGDVALGNAAVARERPEDGGKVVELAESPPLPSYLVAFVVGPFDVVDAGVAGHHGTPLRFVVPRGRGAETGYAARVTPRIVGLLEDYFGMPYPYGKLDVAVVPRYWGSMEHPGLVALGQPLTLIAPAESSPQREMQYADIAAHELAHYWFGDYVTMAWWDDLWLNESFATWMDTKITDALEPSWNYGLERTRMAFWGMSADALPTARTLRGRVASKTDLASAIDNDITYFKGASVLTMFEAWLTPEVFQKAVRAYMAAHAFGSATADDFLAALDAVKPDAGAAFAGFVDRPGFPFVSVAVDCDGGQRAVTLRQRRYLPFGAQAPEETWRVPVCARYPKGGKDLGVACALLEGDTATVPIDAPSCPAWVMGNADARGYYHVAYTPDALRAALSTRAGLTLAERASALHDASALVSSGDLPLADALALVPDSAAATERHVVRAGLRLVRLTRDAAMDDAENARFDRFLHAAYGRRAAELGLVRKNGDDVDASLLRPEVLEMDAVRGEDPALRKRAHDLALAWLRDPQTVSPELVDPILAAGAATNDQTLFESILGKARAETDHTKLAQLFAALGAFTSPELARRADALVTEPAFDVRDSIGVLATQFGQHATRALAWTFMKASFDVFASRMRNDELAFDLVELTKSFCDTAHEADVKAFFEPRAAKVDGMEHAVSMAVQSIDVCASAFAKNRPGLDAFLAKY
jgi:aminopeptidase N